MAVPDHLLSLLQTAKEVQSEADALGIGRPSPIAHSSSGIESSWLQRFDEVVEDTQLVSACRQLFLDGHYARAVEEAFKCLNNAVKAKSGLTKSDGDTLMREAFSASNPKLRLNRMRTPTDESEQRGYMDLFAGAMKAIRNPRAHEHALQDDPHVALELLALANHLMGKVVTSKKTRTRAKRKP